MPLFRPLPRGRDLAGIAADRAADVLAPLQVTGRGLRRQAAWARARWSAAPKDRRGPVVLLAAGVLAGLVLLPYGILLGITALLGAAAWAGRDRHPGGAEQAAQAAELKLQAVYAALGPYLAHRDDPKPLYSRDGDYRSAFTTWEFDGEGRLALLELGYPPYFTDTEPAARSRIEQVLQSKAGRGREFRFLWDEETNRLRAQALAPLPDDIPAQPFLTGPGEVVLGFTDSAGGNRMIPVHRAAGTSHQPPVLWRTGPRAAEPHLLALGTPGAGTSTLLRALALQALPHGDVMVIDGAGGGEHACLVGRPGVLTVETSLHGALAALEWAAQETERRLEALSRARQRGEAAPEDALRPLWLLLDRPTELGELSRAGDRPDPQDLLEAPLRHGRAARVTVVVADHLTALDRIRPAVRAATRARVLLGTATPEQTETVLGGPLGIAPPAYVPAGRGYARIGTAAPVRLQVPATPDPLDDRAPAWQRDAVAALLPHRDHGPNLVKPSPTGATALSMSGDLP